ncbi:variant surface glycoprotein (VSG), putative [Trypanosoma brucei gambiense DAL972]|uniref:Variant surface glycoprotein (VSG), putative n=1 Tax=Trypanosoma brucei gambiense (strain MHOM/CI/86/DAL972) TaxID=679716 RepID=C9ZKT0_TRYB9|nr:variant surface glycoprotein (VSG), putative [Trypanosoma brucei gambiense DAL972]CBH09670.1 variant surface glycoprotein (VSG), putative [Trypanosoma brucei gambiense DAL972]|eukprot:XP_011771966.1 variant surface glycoprotein (VSG), putative [Trypanosoma brucei gambiense DAL972]
MHPQEILYLTLATIASCTSNAEDETFIEAVTSPCYEVQYLYKLISHYETKITSAMTNQKQLTLEYTALTLATTYTSSGLKRPAYMFLAMATGRALHQQQQEIDKGQGQINQLLSVLQARRAQTKAILHREVDALKYDNGSNGQQAQNGLSTNSDFTCDVKTTAVQPNPDTCATKTDTGKHMDDTVITELPKTKNVKLTPDSRFAGDVYLIKVAATGDVDSQGSALTTYKPGACVSSGEGARSKGSINVGFGITAITRDKQKDAFEKTTIYATGNTTICTDDNADAKSHTITTKQVAAAICNLHNDNIKIIPRPIYQTKETLARTQTLKRAAQLLNSQGINSAEEDSKQTSAVKALLPSGEATLISDMIDPLANEHISYKADNGRAKVNLKKANSADHIATTLAFCFAKEHAAKVAAGAQKTSPDTKKEEKCKEGREKSKCTADTDCEHSDGKCKLKEGVKAEWTGTT